MKKILRKSRRSAERRHRAAAQSHGLRPGRFVLAGSIAIACLAAPHFAGATAYYWDTTNGLWQTAADWTTDPTGSSVIGSAIPGRRILSSSMART